MPTQLWPPIAQIRGRFTSAHDAPPDRAAARQSVAPGPAEEPIGALPGPLEDLARRRQALAQRNFDARWLPGRLVGLSHQGQMLGVLLDQPEGASPLVRWHGWLTSSDADWAGAFDVVLEPQDEPFEPSFGMVQVWNPVTIIESPRWNARVFGELSATRLAAIRAVHDEWLMKMPLDIAPEPGFIALREVADVFSVLTGTPLAAEGDPRTEYQALYRTAAHQLCAAATHAASHPAQAPHANPGLDPGLKDARTHTGEGFGARVRRWFGADWVRPAFALLAFVVVGQSVLMLSMPGREDEAALRFRNTPPSVLPAPDASQTLLLFWKDGVGVEESTRLLRSVPAEIVAGPDPRGAYTLRVTDPENARARLAASPLVESVAVPP